MATSNMIVMLCLIIYGYLIDTIYCQRPRHDNIIKLDTFPNPATEHGVEFCGRGQKSFICDPKQFLNYKVADEIDEIIHNATKSKLVWCSTKPSQIEGQQDTLITNKDPKTRENYDGLEIGVAIISSFRDFPHRRYRHDDDVGKKSKTYAKSIHDQWGVGMSGCNNAVMIFITVYDRYLYISTGSSIKSIITDTFINKFIIPKYVRPLMKQSKYGEAIKFMIESIIDVLQNSDNLENHPLYQSYVESTKPTEFLGLSVETWFIIILVLCGAAYLGYKFYSERDYRACSRHLAELHAARQSRRFNQSSCPICLEDFPANNGGDGNGDAQRQTAILICGHKFCKECLDAWFSSQSASNQKCPICRHDRDDWSAVHGEGEEKEEKKQSDTMEDETEEKRDDDDDGGYRPSGAGGGYSKQSTSDDTFYEDNNSNVRQRRGGRDRYDRYDRYGGMNMNDWMFQQELMFRMSRIRYMYPRYVSNDMYSRWSRPGYSGNYCRDQSFVRANPNWRPPPSRSGSSWSSGRSSGFSFGGGSSSGGGGGGGGW